VLDLPELRGAPPWPMAEVDELRDQHDGLLAQRRALQAALKSFDEDLAALLQAQRQADRTLRLKREALDKAGSSDDTALLRAQHELADMQAALAGHEFARIRSRQEGMRGLLSSLDHSIQQLEHEVNRVRRQQALDDALLAARVGNAERDRRALHEERRQLLAQIEQLGDARNRSRASVQVELDALRATLETLVSLDAHLRDTVDHWKLRQAAIRADTLLSRSDAAEAIDRARQRLAAHIHTEQDQIEVVRSSRQALQAQLAALDEDSPLVSDTRMSLSALDRQTDALQRLLAERIRMHALLGRSRADLGLEAKVASAAEGWSLARNRLSAAGRAFWDYELFTVTESSHVDGRTVPIEYGVTVGKSVGVLILLAAGWWLAAPLGRKLLALAARSLGLSPQVTRVVRRWVGSLLMLALLMVALKLARIPLTAFAFLGGALAIGLGFGAQNVLRNLMSGAIILAERKIRVGDVITFQGLSGTVTAVDLRSTSVRGFDGIVTIVPNSTLLEQPISSWTEGGPDVRRTIRIGLVHGSDVKRARELIEACARAQAGVHATPAPSVLLDEISPNGLQLLLYFWFEVSGPLSILDIESDLRIAIDLALREAGITLAHTQHDVHLDTREPLRIELGPRMGQNGE
jgi:small-conductance mechanosensitive channel